LGKYVNWTFVFAQTSTTSVHVKFYIDYEPAAEIDLAITEGYSFAQKTDSDYIGIGGVYGTTYNSSAMGASIGKNQYIDNVMLCNDALTIDEVRVIKTYNEVANKKALASVA
jgi:hypothetical protein